MSFLLSTSDLSALNKPDCPPRYTKRLKPIQSSILRWRGKKRRPRGIPPPPRCAAAQMSASASCPWAAPAQWCARGNWYRQAWPAVRAGRSRSWRSSAECRVKRNGVRHIAFVVDHQLGDALAVKAAQTSSVTASCSAAHSSPASATLMTSAKAASSNVDLNASTRWCGSRLTKPTVSTRMICRPLGSTSLRAVGWRGKQHVDLKDLLAAQGVQQAGFAHIGVADQRHHGHIVLLAERGGSRCGAFPFLQLFFRCSMRWCRWRPESAQFCLTGAAAPPPPPPPPP